MHKLTCTVTRQRWLHAHIHAHTHTNTATTMPAKTTLGSILTAPAVAVASIPPSPMCIPICSTSCQTSRDTQMDWDKRMRWYCHFTQPIVENCVAAHVNKLKTDCAERYRRKPQVGSHLRAESFFETCVHPTSCIVDIFIALPIIRPDFVSGRNSG